MMVRSLLSFVLLSATALSAALPAVDARATTKAPAADVATLQIVVSKQTQSLAVYQDGAVIARSKVSTGKEGHTTPSGIFSIIQKAKYHESNLYSNAPMPWMQRITWSGVALHESSSVPNRPASHGCVRLPAAFAKQLFGMTRLGAHVIITDAPVTPAPIADPLLAQLQPLPAVLSQAKLRGVAADPVEVAMIDPADPDKPANGTDAVAGPPEPPLRILITRRGGRETVRDVQEMLGDLGFETGGINGEAGPLTRLAIQGYKRWKGLPTKGTLLTPDFLAMIYGGANRPMPPAGQIYIRQRFSPVLDAPIAIADPDQPLGTHLFEAVKVDRAAGTAQWQVTTLEEGAGPASSGSSIVAVGSRQTDAQTSGVQASDGADAAQPAAAAAVLARLTLPDDIRARIATKLVAGTSITVTDHGLGQETDIGTDFITVLPNSGD